MPATKKYKPTTPGQRGTVRSSFEEITKKKPEKALVVGGTRSGGRGVRGVITVRHRGGGHKRKHRIVDLKRAKRGVPGKVIAIEYDPYRSSRLALVQYVDGAKGYILAANGVQVGAPIEAGPDASLKPGCALPLRVIPTGQQVHNIELNPGKGGQLVRSAGTSAQVMAREDNRVSLRLPSGETRWVNQECYATIGQVGNVEHKNLKIGKAGRKRHMGWRPTVRGSAMTPRDHPHGGGEGRSPIGMPHPKTPWGKPALGKRTRRNKRTNVFIVRRRNK